MMGWLSSSRSTSSPAGMMGAFSIDRRKVEPGAAFSLLENHWKQAKAVMDNVSAQPPTSSAPLTVLSHLNQMISFLKLTRGGPENEQSCKQFWLQNQCADRVMLWLHGMRITGTQLEYENEIKLVQTLESLCDLASQDGELLGFGSSIEEENENGWNGAYSLSSLLLEYSLKTDPSLGPPARNAFIILVQLSGKLGVLEECFSNDRELTNLPISFLSASFAQLPTFEAASPAQLEPFIIQLKFVDGIIHSAPPGVAEKIADCFSTAFLCSVMLTAVGQDEQGNRSSIHRQDDQFLTSLHEEIAIVTDYMKIVCENLTHPLLVRSLCLFVLSHLLPILVERVGNPNVKLTTSTLSLLSTLLTFYNEDIWYALILKHLIPQTHLMVSQRSLPLPDPNYHESCLLFLSLIPTQVVQAMGPEGIRLHYITYLDDELKRVRWFVRNEFNDNQSTNDGRAFSKWKYKYDGTDEWGTVESPEEKLVPNEQDHQGLQNVPEENQNGNIDPLSSELETNDQPSTVDPLFTTISLQPNTDEQLNSLDTATSSSSPSIERSTDGYDSLDTTSSYGPLLDTLFLHLNNLPRLSPDLILIITELLTTLASSRIPLITSILLDTKIILQPSYISFPMLLNRIRVELERGLGLNNNILNEVWTTMNKEMMTTNNQSSLSSSASMNFIHSLSSSLDASFGGEGSITDNLKKRISSSGILNGVFQKRRTSIESATGGGGGRPSSVGGEGPASTSRNSAGQSSGVTETQFMAPVSPIGGVQTNQQRSIQPKSTEPPPTESPRLIYIRAIYFSHWLLELAAVAHQLCWKRPAVS